MKAIFAIVVGLSSALGIAQSYLFDRDASFPGIKPVLLGGSTPLVGYTATGGGNFRIYSPAEAALDDRFRSFTHLGGVPSVFGLGPIDSSGSLIVTGNVSIAGSARMFVTRVNRLTGVVSWTFIEPARAVATFGAEALVIGDRVIVAAALATGPAAICYRLTDGVELWRTTVANALSNRGCRVFKDGAENIYLTCNRQVGNGTQAFVRSVNFDGVFRWERSLSTFEVADAQMLGNDLMVLGQSLISVGSPATLEITRLSSVDGSTLATRSISRSVRRTPTFDLSFGGNGRVLVRLDVFPDKTREDWILPFELTSEQFQARTPGNTVGSATDLDSLPHVLSVLQGAASSVGNLSRDFEPLSANLDGSLGIAFTSPSAVATDLPGRILVLGDDGTNIVFKRLSVAPQARNDLFETFAANELDFPAPGVLANDLGESQATLALVSQPANGTVTLDSDGSFHFSRTKVAIADDTFTYRLTKGSATSTATVTLRLQPHATGITLSLSRVKGGTSVTGRVIMSSNRIGTVLTLPMFDNSTATSISPTTVTVQPGASQSSEFIVFTAPVRVLTRSIIQSNDGDFSVEEIAPLDVEPPFITSIEAVETTIVGGAPASFRLNLDGRAPSNGMPISVADDSTAILVPTTVVVPQNETQFTFSAPTAVVTSSRTAVVTATSNGISKSVTIAIVGASLAINPTTVTGGFSSTGTVTLTSNAIINSVVFALTDNSTSSGFTGSQTAIVPAGFRTGQFTIISVPVSSNRTSTITATNNGVSITATLTIQAATISAIVASPNPIRGGNPFAGLAQLTGKAAGTPIVVTLADNSNNVTMPPNVSVASGSDFGLFVGSTTAVTSSTMVVLTATVGSTSRTTTLVLTP